jgi:hypothetical protein
MRTKGGLFYGNWPVDHGMRSGDGIFFIGIGQSEPWDEDGR